MSRYFTPKASIIKTDDELNHMETLDGNAVRLSTHDLQRNYQEVHMRAWVKIDHDAMARGYAEMGKINKEYSKDTFIADAEGFINYEKSLSGASDEKL